MLYRLYSSPFFHCPRLCPYDPPVALRRDDYDPGREEAALAFCGEICGHRSEDDRPCLRRRDEQQARFVELRRREQWPALPPAMATPRRSFSSA